MEDTYLLNSWRDKEEWEKENHISVESITNFEANKCYNQDIALMYADQYWNVTRPNGVWTLLPILH